VSPAAALTLVRRTRRRLEGLRLLRAAARGALVGAAIALVLVLLGKALGRPEPAAWWLPLAGALAGLGVAAARGAIGLVPAALFLDARLHTDERFTTLLARPGSPLAPRWAMELEGHARIPALVWPREAGLVPVALFCLFAATLVPAAGGSGEEFANAGETAPSPASAEPAEHAPADPDAAAQALSGASELSPERRREIERAIDESFARPEDRTRARAELARAEGGDAAARERLGEALLEGAGALGGAESSRGGTTAPGASGVDARLSSPYPGEYEFLRAYRVAKARLLRDER